MLQWILFFSLFMNPVFADTECPYVSVSNNNVGDRRKDKSKLRLVQYNVEWLFIDYYTNMDCPGNGCTWKTVADAQTHLNYVVNVIKDVDPDIINFCEVEGCDELNMLKEQLDGTYMPYLKKGTDTGTGQNVGLLTRVDPVINLYRTELKHNYPLNGSKCGYTGSQSSSGVSKHYITEFKFNGMNVAFISAHFIAIPTDPARCAQREAQASVLQTVISDYIFKNYEVIVLGDFNDYDAEILDVNSDKPTSIVLDILKGFKGDLANSYVLHNIAEQIPQNERYSDWWDSDNNCNTTSKNDYSMIDHVLVTDAIRKNVENVFIYHGYDEYCGKYDSDHYPVIVDLII
jgi:exonuclease III